MSSLGYLPIALVVLAFATFTVTYIIAVVRGDVSAAFPYISDTGAEIPESCIFGQFLNLSACLAFCTMYIRYKSIVAISGTDEDRWLRRMNKIAMVMGVLSATGVSLVANFQERPQIEPVHFTGAALTFICGLLYTFLQAAISYHMYPDYSGLYICRVRLAISLTSLCSFIITAASAGYAVYQWNTKLHRMGDTKFKWKPDDPGYSAHVVSTVGEWMTAITFLCFFFTYVREFFKFELNLVMRPLVRHLEEQPYYYNRENTNERSPLLS